MACPACSAVSAMPTATTPQEGATHVGMHCRHCGHDWLFEVATDTEVTNMRSGVACRLFGHHATSHRPAKDVVRHVKRCSL